MRALRSRDDTISLPADGYDADVPAEEVLE